MGKYIIELEEKEIAYKTVNSNGCPMIGLLHPVPYTEPDLEQVRKEAYEEGWKDAEDHYEKGYNDGYDTGLSDAWECARKIVDCAIPYSVLENYLEIGECTADVIKHLPASKAIEVVRQYEQEKEKIKVGDEVKSGNERYVVLQKYLNNIDEPMAVLFNRRDGEISYFHLYNGAIFEKTGRHFPEIAEVLQKMREDNA